MRMILLFLRVVMARFRGRPLELEVGRNRFHLYPTGEMLPVIAGGSPEGDEPDDEPEPEPVVPEPVSDEPAVDDEPEPDDDEPEPKPDGEFDEKRAMRTIRQQRAEAKKLKAERDEAKAKADELQRAQESEQERTVRERDDAKADADAERTKRERMSVDLAIRDAAVEADVPPKKVKRLMRLIEREAISVDSEGEVTGVEEALETFLEEFPEFVEAVEVDDESDDPKPEPRGGNPDRKRGQGEMTPAKASKLAREAPARFADMLAEGKIPRSALGGVRYDKLKSEGRLNEEG